MSKAEKVTEVPERWQAPQGAREADPAGRKGDKVSGGATHAQWMFDWLSRADILEAALVCAGGPAAPAQQPLQRHVSTIRNGPRSQLAPGWSEGDTHTW